MKALDVDNPSAIRNYPIDFIIQLMKNVHRMRPYQEAFISYI